MFALYSMVLFITRYLLYILTGIQLNLFQDTESDMSNHKTSLDHVQVVGRSLMEELKISKCTPHPRTPSLLTSVLEKSTFIFKKYFKFFRPVVMPVQLNCHLMLVCL